MVTRKLYHPTDISVGRGCGTFRRWGLAGGSESLGPDFESLKLPSSSGSLSLLRVCGYGPDLRASSSGLLLPGPFLPPTLTGSPSVTVSQHELFLALVMVVYHSNQKQQISCVYTRAGGNQKMWMRGTEEECGGVGVKGNVPSAQPAAQLRDRMYVVCW